jgi:signal transduction histidine kinase
MLRRLTAWPPSLTVAALILGVAYVVAVQTGLSNPRGSDPATIVVMIVSGLGTAALCYALGRSASLAWSVTGLLILTASTEWGDLTPLPVMVTVGLWLVGRAVRWHRTIAASLRVRAFELESERERFVEEAVRYERDRIARELHDVIAHNVSIMVIQASAGQRLAPDARAAADDLFGIIAEMASEASADIAGLARVLAPAQEPPESQQRIEELLVRTAKTGVRIDYDIVGDLREISGHAAQIAYRVLQEGLTNAIRHAPGAAIDVNVTCVDGLRLDGLCLNGLRLEVTNQPASAGAIGVGDVGSGHGLTGLAERVAAVGGTFHSGALPAGGWRLSAALPSSA